MVASLASGFWRYRPVAGAGNEGLSSSLKTTSVRRETAVRRAVPAHRAGSLVPASQAAVTARARLLLRAVSEGTKGSAVSVQISGRVRSVDVRDGVGPVAGAVGRADGALMAYLPSASLVPACGVSYTAASACQGGASGRLACAGAIRLFEEPS